MNNQKGENAFNGTLSRLKISPSFAMDWNFSIGNANVAQRLMLQATLPSPKGLSPQQNLFFKIFAVLIVNAYRIW